MTLTACLYDAVGEIYEVVLVIDTNRAQVARSNPTADLSPSHIPKRTMNTHTTYHYAGSYKSHYERHGPGIAANKDPTELHGPNSRSVWQLRHTGCVAELNSGRRSQKRVTECSETTNSRQRIGVPV